MDHESPESETLPYYYRDGADGAPSLMPFFVAPIGDFQATLLIGPENVAAVHTQFINDLYSRPNSDKGVSARAFLFRSKLCVGVTLPTNLRDKGGRSGLFVSFGVLVNGAAIARCHSAISAYIKIFIDNLNRTFSLTLPANGVDTLLTAIQMAHEKKDFFDIYTRFLHVLDVLRVASRTIEDLLVTIPRRKSFLRWVRRWGHKIVKKKTPKVIMYPDHADLEEVLSIFLRELEHSLSKLGKTGLPELLKTNSDNSGIISLVAAPNVISSARKVTYKKTHGKVYLRIF